MKTNNINTKRNKLKERNKNVKLCKESVNYFFTHKFIDELSKDEKYYTTTLIKYFLSPIKERNEELEDAIDYISWKQEEQTSDKQFYMIALLEYCINN